jgi:hypothetical protein
MAEEIKIHSKKGNTKRLEALILHYYTMMRTNGYSTKQVEEYQQWFGIISERYEK